MHILQLASRQLIRLLVDVSPVADGDNNNQQYSVIDRIDDPIVANSESVPVAPAELS